MPTPKFKTGDLVELKSGGPTMVVSSKKHTEADGVWCKWFGRDPASPNSYFIGPHETGFHVDELKAAED